MKKLLVVLLALGSLTAYAGKLKNKSSGETIQFELNSSNQELTVTSSSAGIGNKVIQLEQIDGKKSNIKLFAGTLGAVELSEDSEFAVGLYLALPATAAYDLALLPIKASVKMFQNMKFKKDLNKLMNAVSTDETVTVSNNRFRRIVKLLK